MRSKNNTINVTPLYFMLDNRNSRKLSPTVQNSIAFCYTVTGKNVFPIF